MCGPSQQETTAQQQAQQEADQLQKDFNQQFQDQQQFLKSFLIPNIEGMVTNPQGFGAAALSDLTASSLNTISQSEFSRMKEENLAFQTQNMAGLPSGVQEVIKAQIANAAAGEKANATLNIGLANEQMKEHQREIGISAAQNVPGLIGQAPQTQSGMINANQNSFNQAYQMAQQGNWWQPILAGVVGAGAQLGMAALTGGSSLALDAVGTGLAGGQTLAGAAGGAGGVSSYFGGPSSVPTTTSSISGGIS